jgi:RNA polymerase sigma-70 factor (ECF subfamily)
MSVNPVYHQNSAKLEEEQGWIRRAQKDPEKFGPLYQKYYEQIFRYIYQRMDDQEQALDVTSQVFMKALKNINKFEFRGLPLSSWLYRIAKSELYQAFRDKKALRTVNLETVHLTSMVQDMEEEQNDGNRERLFKVLKCLNEKDLQLIELRYFEKRSYKEIGEILDLTENNAKVKSFRALEKLKRHFIDKQ